MEKMKKLTKKDYFAQLKEIVKNDAELVAFIDHEVELLSKKNTGNSQTKVQKDNEALKEILIEELKKIGKAVTITELMNESQVIKDYTYKTKVNGETKETKLTNQKISAIFTQLVNNDKTVIKVTDKKKSYFSIAK